MPQLSPKQQFQSLPSPIKKIVGPTNFQKLSLNTIGPMSNVDNYKNSIKTSTALQLLSPQKYIQPQPVITSQPIILVFCQPSQQICIENNKVYPYTPISYVSWMEGAGATCIPLAYDVNEATMQFLLERSHGLLLPGGGSNLYRNWDKKQGQGPVMIGFLKIWRYINKLWNKGIPYPIWGTCLGFEMMLLALSNDVKILSCLNSRGHQLEIYSDYENSVICKRMPLAFRFKAENYKVINFQHSFGISVKKFLNSPRLVDKLRITQISKDKDGKWFCSALQGKNLPIFITQYHPQKQAYQWTKSGEIIHNKASVEISQYLATSFIAQARKFRAVKQFGSPTQQLFYSFNQYKQLHTYKMYKVYAINFKYRQSGKDKAMRKQIKNKNNRSQSMAKPIKAAFI